MSFLAGKRIVFTGKLASMTRPEAAELVRSQGGSFRTSVTRQTSFLVVGQEGWPLKKDGSLSEKLETAQDLQAKGHAIAVLTEEELLDRLGLEGATDGIHKRFTLAQLGRLLKVPRDRFRTWMRLGLLHPVETTRGVCYFDFQQASRIRMLWDLTQAGVKTTTIRSSLQRLAGWLSGLEASLDQLRLFEQDGRLLVRLEDGQLSDASGQLHFDFEGPSAVASRSLDPSPADSVAVEETGQSLEAAGRLREAADAYREALYADGANADLCFNLANVLHALGDLGASAERYRQAIELDHTHAESWNNLGNVLLEMAEHESAVDAYRQALDVCPQYADPHYNLAEALETSGRFSEARRHWKEYLRLEPIGPWADYARRRLANEVV